jgi:hypothetical protein
MSWFQLVICKPFATTEERAEPVGPIIDGPFRYSRGLALAFCGNCGARCKGRDFHFPLPYCKVRLLASRDGESPSNRQKDFQAGSHVLRAELFAREKGCS